MAQASENRFGYECSIGLYFRSFTTALVFEELLNQRFTLCVTTDILAEYAEIIGQQMGYVASESILGVIENLPNIELITTHYRFGLLADEDDNRNGGP